ncbi:GIY-YIG nuclease family protein [Erythrobacter sp. NFXS35]|uniref:GIY-YIG nuclease family protein n=1 Tax=Erythrobacter sp. NFXS35 TaxID=2818436 RepID=UPI0032DF8071
MRRETEPSCYVYFFQAANGPIKIGIARNVPNRLAQVQSHNAYLVDVLAITEGGRAQEMAYHRRFKQWRLKGEWFEPAADILAEIDRLGQHRGLTARTIAFEMEKQRLDHKARVAASGGGKLVDVALL